MSGPRRRRIGYWVLLAALALLVMEGLSYLAIASTRGVLDEPIRRTGDIYAEQSRLIGRFLDTAAGRRELPDTVLGWRYRPGLTSPMDHLNSQGLRGTREYGQAPRPGIVRVAAFGDSFVYGTEVPDTSAWTAVLERGDSTVEVLNYGVGGYGTDQAYLRYLHEGSRVAPRIVVIGFTPVNLARIVNVYQRFMSTLDGPFIKPRFLWSSAGGLHLLSSVVPDEDDYRRYLRSPETVRELGRFDYWYEPAIYENAAYDWSATVRLVVNAWIRFRRRYADPDRLVVGGVLNERSVAFGLQVAVLEAFVDAVRHDGGQALVVLFPDRESIRRAHEGDIMTYEPLKRKLEGAGVPVLDLAPAFVNAIVDGDLAPWFMPGGHYSRAGNAVVAAAVGSWLRVHIPAHAAAADRSLVQHGVPARVPALLRERPASVRNAARRLPAASRGGS